MNYDDFFLEAKTLKVRLPENTSSPRNELRLDNEALFQLPLLAMVILVLAKGRSKPDVGELGQIVGECLERTVAGFKGTSQYIGWSANLRMRTMRALLFLERRGLAEVDVGSRKQIIATENGRKIVQVASEGDTPLSYALATVERSFENIRAERGIAEEVE